MVSPYLNTSPIHSTRIALASPEQFIVASPHYSSDPYFPSEGNQMAYYNLVAEGYPNYTLPVNAGQQYLSPQSSSPCVKAAARRKHWRSQTVRGSHPVRKHIIF